MKAKTIVLTLALCFVGAVLCFAKDANLGTWKLSEAKSKLAPGAPKNSTVVYEAAGDSVKVTIAASTRMGRRRITTGPANTTAKTIPSPAIRIQTHGHSQRSTIVR
jgi:hypothetical protein